jgi:predicted acetyltransferase
VDVTIRRATEADWPELAFVDSRNFGFQYSEQDLEDNRLIVDVERFYVAVDDGRIVGLTGDYGLEMTVPGGTALAVPGLTWVSVSTTHRRRGLLTALFAQQHRGYLEQGYPLAILGASESGIYGRFGYGPATQLRRVELDRRLVRMRADLPVGEAVRMVDTDEARRLVPAIHDRWRRQTPGAIARSEAWWDFLFLDREHRRKGASPRFHTVHPDGFVTYRVQTQMQDGFPANSVEVLDLFAIAPEAHAELWRFLLSIDLAAAVRTWDAPPGDPVEFLLDQPRQARTTEVSDGTWVRILDVAAALAARTYLVEGSLVLDVHDAFLDRGGRFHLEGGPDGATCRRTDRTPDLVLGISTLGSIYLGAHAPHTLARAQLIDARSDAVLARADAMFATDRPPHTGTNF